MASQLAYYVIYFLTTPSSLRGLRSPTRDCTWVHGMKAWSPNHWIAKVCVCACVYAQLCLTLCDPINCRQPGSYVHGILQERILELVTISTPGDLPDPGIKPASLASPAFVGRFFTIVPPGKPGLSRNSHNWLSKKAVYVEV